MIGSYTNIVQLLMKSCIKEAGKKYLPFSSLPRFKQPVAQVDF